MHRVTPLALLAVVLLSPLPERAQEASQGLREEAPQASALKVASALSQICPQDLILGSAHGQPSGCNGCPPGTTARAFTGLARGSGRWTISGETVGHFTASGATNLLSEGGGCEPHANNFGGTFVFLLNSGPPKLLRYNAGLMTTPCRELRLQDRRDFLVCEGWWEGQGYQTSSVYSLAFDPDGRARRTTLFMTHDDVGACGNATLPEGDYLVQASEIRSVNFPDLSGTGRSDLSITATLGKKRLTAAQREDCGARESTFSEASIQQKVYTVQYLFDGVGFRPTPASLQILELFDRVPPAQ